LYSPALTGQDHSHDEQTENTDSHQETADHAHGTDDAEHEEGCGVHAHHEFDPGQTAFHHISDANVYSIGPFNLPLPCILYAPESGWSVFMSNKFGFDVYGHGEGHKAYDGYVLNGGSVMRVDDESFPQGSVDIEGFVQSDHGFEVCYQGNLYPLHDKSKMDGGMFGGGITSFYDFSLTKNVVAIMLICLFLFLMFRSIAKRYTEREGKAPKGLQSFMEPIFVFIQDEVVKPFLGDKWEKYQPFIMALFFFILGLNLFGQIPFLGGANVTGNLAVTMVLALIAFFVVNINGNKSYWEHIFWMPGVPAWVKTILTPVEFLGVFIKPLTLMLRLFANITAGHMVLIIFVSLIFIFGDAGKNIGASIATIPGSALLTLFMMAIELLVAFIQAFVFAILTASYIGAATEEHH
jgi:F-type H+-transporting ATPase subunit a